MLYLIFLYIAEWKRHLVRLMWAGVSLLTIYTLYLMIDEYMYDSDFHPYVDLV